MLIGRKTVRAFTLMELLVALGILMILAGIMLPYLHRVRESDRRIRCSNNLWQIGRALSQYGAANRYELPRVIYDEQRRGYTAFTGAYVADAFAKGSPVSANDVTASLWLLVHSGYISSEFAPPSAVFVCPSSGDEVDMMLGSNGKPVGPRERSNFASPSNLSYSYANPFGNAPGYGLKSDFILPNFILLADRNPGKSAAEAARADSPLRLRIANSRNHAQAGQNVLFGDSHVEFIETPYCGVNGDNIYTAQAARPPDDGRPPVADANGQFGRDLSPAWQADSYLIPGAEE